MVLVLSITALLLPVSYKDGTPTDNKPFALNYGVELRYRVFDRLHLIGEVSGISTMRHFDCVGTKGKIGDNMLNVSVGVSYALGKRGWKRVIDAEPYINQNNYLLDHYAYQDQANNGNGLNTTVVSRLVITIAV